MDFGSGSPVITTDEGHKTNAFRTQPLKKRLNRNVDAVLGLRKFTAMFEWGLVVSTTMLDSILEESSSGKSARLRSGIEHLRYHRSRKAVLSDTVLSHSGFGEFMLSANIQLSS